MFATPVAQQGNFKVSVAGTAPGSIPHDIALKVTQIPGGQLSEATGFAISPESVVQVKQGENIIVTTSENLKVNNVKAKNVQGQQVDLTPLPNNIWSLQNLVPGVYLLDVIVDMSSSGILGVYETVLVILKPDRTPLAPASVINQLSILIDTEIIFGPQPPGDNQTEPIPPPGDNQTDQYHHQVTTRLSQYHHQVTTRLSQYHHQNVLKQVQNYVVKNHHQKMNLQIQITMPTMGTGMVMLAVMGMERTARMEMGTTAKVVKIFQLCLFEDSTFGKTRV